MNKNTATRIANVKISRLYQMLFKLVSETVNWAAAAPSGDEYVPLPTLNEMPKRVTSATAEYVPGGSRNVAFSPGLM
jgi:hypothetical protein